MAERVTVGGEVAEDHRADSMTKEVFGVFGDADDFERFRDEQSFDRIARGDAATVGVRDPSLGDRGRSTCHTAADGTCVIWGEAYATPSADDPADLGRWFLGRFAERGRRALAELNGSYLVFVEHDGQALVATDPLRSWECFYADASGVRTFGTDAAAVARTIDGPSIDRRSLLEFLFLGTVMGDGTLLEGLSRVPFDGYLTEDAVDELDRFVYAPAEFDYARELGNRLKRAIDRRSHYPDRKGLLLSAGYDSRTILPRLSGDRHCYTIGAASSREVEVARRIANQYGSRYTTLNPGPEYLLPDDEQIRHTQGIKESLHIHHGGYDDRLEVSSMYHGLLYDTLFKGYFLERDGVELFGKQLPSMDLDPDPAPIDALLDTLGYMPDGSERLGDCLADTLLAIESTDPREFLERRLQSEFKRCWERTDSVHNAMDLLVIRNQPTLPFHTHIADNYVEGFVALDVELLDWHLRTPPRHRNQQTFLEALAAFDPAVLTHRPPDKPYQSVTLNQIERFVRRKTPLANAFQPAWPDRRALYDRYDLDQELFPTVPAVHDLPVRQKLRINDVCEWLRLL